MQYWLEVPLETKGSLKFIDRFAGLLAKSWPGLQKGVPVVLKVAESLKF